MLSTLFLLIFDRNCVTLFVNSLFVVCCFLSDSCVLCVLGNCVLRMPEVQIICFIHFFLWSCSVTLAMASLFLRIRDYTRHTTVGALDE